MPKQPFDFSVPPEMKALAEKSVEQARQAFDGFVKVAEQAASGFEQRAKTTGAGAQDVTQKAMAFTEQNVARSFDLAQKLVSAKDINEVLALHAEYVRQQISALSDQARALSQTATELAARTAQNKEK